MDSTGALTASTAYDSFGNATGSLATRYGFTGREYDDFTGLMYYRARFYDPKLGRFVSEDPIGFWGGDINLYGYVWNTPQNYSDPTGLVPYKLPANPGKNGSNLPNGWKPVPEHRYGERWLSPNGNEGVDFHPGEEGKTGFNGKDHWHKINKGKNGKWEKDKSGGRKGGHYLPGDEVDVKAYFPVRPDLTQPTMEELRLNEACYRNMEAFWWDVAAGGAAIGVVLTGGALGVFSGSVEAGGAGALAPAFGM